jgi:hypothetical protein
VFTRADAAGRRATAGDRVIRQSGQRLSLALVAEIRRHIEVRRA